MPKFLAVDLGLVVSAEGDRESIALLFGQLYDVRDNISFEVDQVSYRVLLTVRGWIIRSSIMRDIASKEHSRRNAAMEGKSDIFYQQRP
jgi:hypothetical protein